MLACKTLRHRRGGDPPALTAAVARRDAALNQVLARPPAPQLRPVPRACGRWIAANGSSVRLERPGYPFDIAVIILLESSPEGPLPFEQVRAVFNQRCYRSPGLSRVVVPAPLGIGEEWWMPAAELDIDQHVHQMTIPAPGDMPALLGTVIEVSKEPLERGRPLWEAWYLTGMADGTAALVLRTHHATLDGIGIAQLHHILFDTEPTAVDVNQQPPPLGGRAVPSQLRRALSEIPDRITIEGVTTGRILGRVWAAVPQVLVGIPARVMLGAGAKLGAVLFNRADPDPVHLPELPGVHPLTHRSPAGDPVQQACGQPA